MIAYDAEDQPLDAVAAFTVNREHGARVARFIGVRASDIQYGDVAARLIETATPTDVETILAAIHDQPEHVDVLALAQQLERWRGIANSSPRSQVRQLSTNPLSAYDYGARLQAGRSDQHLD